MRLDRGWQRIQANPKSLAAVPGDAAKPYVVIAILRTLKDSTTSALYSTLYNVLNDALPLPLLSRRHVRLSTLRSLLWLCRRRLRGMPSHTCSPPVP